LSIIEKIQHTRDMFVEPSILPTNLTTRFCGVISTFRFRPQACKLPSFVINRVYLHVENKIKISIMQSMKSTDNSKHC